MTVSRRRFRPGRGVGGALLFACALTPALAGIGERNGEIGFEYALARFDSDLLGRTGGRWSVRAGRLETRSLQWEGQVTRARVDDEPLPGAARKVTLTLAVANVIFNFRPRKDIVPYVLAGVGLARLEIEAAGLTSDDTETGYQVAGGGRFFFGDRSPVALRLELSILGSDGFEHSYFHPSVAAGLTFRLGRSQ